MANQIKISQLDTLENNEVNKDIYFPVVYESDPLNRNRRLSVGQIFLGLDSGSKTSPGLRFSGTAKTGFFRRSVNSVERLGLSFGTAGLESYIDGTNAVAIAPVIEGQTSYDLVLTTPSASKVRFSSGTILQSLDNSFNLVKASDSKINAKFDLDLVTTTGSDSITKTYKLPAITASTDSLVSLTSTQTLTNKTIEIDDDNLIFSSEVKNNPTQFKGKFSLYVNQNQPERTAPFKFYLPKTNNSDLQSELIDDRTEKQRIRSKIIQIGGAGVANVFAIDTAGNINFRISLPQVDDGGSWDDENDSRNYNLDLDDDDYLLGSSTIQNITNKKLGNCSIAKYTSGTLQANAINIIGIDLPTAAAYLTFPSVLDGMSTDVNNPSVVTTTTATQILSNKTVVNPTITNNVALNKSFDFDFTNLSNGQTVTLTLPSTDIGLFGLDSDGDLNLGTGRYVDPIFVNAAKTRKVTFDLSLLSANRTQKLPNKSGTLQISDADDDVTLTGKLVNPTVSNTAKDKYFTFDFTDASTTTTFKVPENSGTLALIDSSRQLFFTDIVNTKRVNFNLNAVSNSTTRTISIPDADITIVGIDESQNLTSIDSDLNVEGSLNAQSLSGEFRLKTYFYSTWSL